MAVKKENRRKASAERKKKTDSSEDFSSEINEPRWSVVSFDRRAAQNLTYAEAVEKLQTLAAEKISGLCIITDEAAERMVNGKR